MLCYIILTHLAVDLLQLASNSLLHFFGYCVKLHVVLSGCGAPSAQAHGCCCLQSGGRHLPQEPLCLELSRHWLHASMHASMALTSLRCVLCGRYGCPVVLPLGEAESGSEGQLASALVAPACFFTRVRPAGAVRYDWWAWLMRSGHAFPRGGSPSQCFLLQVCCMSH